jgi:membrane-associated protein
MHFDITELIKTIGMFGVWGIVFAESGLLIGFFLPGDSLLFTAGFLASQGFLNIYVLTIGAFVAAVAGDSVGYSFGKRVGRKIFTRNDSLLFHKDHLETAEDYYKVHGKKTIIIARFVPVVRTFAPIVAGIGDMEYKTFISYNVIGALCWAVGITLLGYTLGNLIPDIDLYLLPIVLGIIFVSVAPNVYHILKEESSRKIILDLLKKLKEKTFSKK